MRATRSRMMGSLLIKTFLLGQVRNLVRSSTVKKALQMKSMIWNSYRALISYEYYL